MELLHVQVAFRHGARLPGGVWGTCSASHGISSGSKPEADWRGTMDGKDEVGNGVRRVRIRAPQGAREEFYAYDRIRADGCTWVKDGEGVPVYLSGGLRAGDLTRRGMQDAYDLGHLLRRLYRDEPALSKVFSSLAPELEVRSTPMRRTIETARGVLTGLLDPDDTAATVDIQLNVDHIGKEWMVCIPFDARADQQLLAHWEAGWHELKSNPPRQLLQDTERLTGWTLPDINDEALEFSCLISGYDELHCRLTEGVLAPTNELLELRDALETQFALEFATAAEGPAGGVDGRTKGLRMGIGGMWREQLARIDSVLAGRPVAKMSLYSGHDFTVFPLMCCLLPEWGTGSRDEFSGANNTKWCPYCGSLETELWTDGRDHFVRLRYCGQPVPHRFADADGLCTLAQFKELVGPFVLPLASEVAARL